MKSTSRKTVIASLLAGGAVAGSFVSAEPAKAQFIGADSQSRVSGAITNVLSNTNTTNFAAEVVFPEKDIAPTGQLTMTVNYGSTGVNGDASQVAISSATFSAAKGSYSANTVEAATARAIDSAAGTTGRFGDVIGIVKQWQSGGSAALD